MRLRRNIKILLAFALACLGALVVIGAALAREPAGIIAGVSVLDSDLSGLTREMADGKLVMLEREVVRAAPLVLRYGDRAWRLQPARIGVALDREKMLDEAFRAGRRGSLARRLSDRRQAWKEGIRIPLQVKIDRARLEDEIGLVAREIAALPEDARLKINPDETVEVIPSREGIAVDTEKVCRDIAGVFGNYDTPPEIGLSLVRASPRKTTRDVLEMGVDSLLAAYTTSFDERDADRAYNIKVAASALDGLLVSSGEVFSFNRMVGPRSSEAGYKNAKVILNNEYVEGLGGGVCQVSSTLYNAVLLANLEIVQRVGHSLPVFYVQPGRDATVTFDYIDFCFRNSTPACIYLKAAVGPGRVTVKIYGNSGSRREVTVRTRVEETMPFREIFEQDPTLKGGETRVKRKGLEGMRVSAERLVLDNGSYRVESLPQSLYRPVDQLTLTGPDFQPSVSAAPGPNAEIVPFPVPDAPGPENEKRESPP